MRTLRNKQKNTAVESALNSTSNNFCFHWISGGTLFWCFLVWQRAAPRSNMRTLRNKQKNTAVESTLNSTLNNFCFHWISDYIRKKPQRQSHANSWEVKFRANSIAILSLFLTLRQKVQEKQNSVAVESALNSTSNNFCFHWISDHTRKKPQRQSHANSGEVKFRADSIAILSLIF